MIRQQYDTTNIFSLPEGRMFIGRSTPEQSIGYLALDPGKKLAPHSRPVEEELIQIEGETTVTLFRDHSPEKVVLRKGDYLRIPPGLLHFHENHTTSASLTFWKFEGDVREIVNAIKTGFEKINDHHRRW